MESDRDLKEKGAIFWDANPCGGNWDNYQEFMDWYQRTEPEMFRILDVYDWVGKRVIEIGIGQGPTLNYLARIGATMCGLDMSFQSLQRARDGAVELAHSEYVRLVQADAERLPFPDGYFDVAISLGVLHHTPDTAAGVREIHRMLKPGGVAVVMLYRSGNPKWWMTRTLRKMSQWVDLISGESNTLAESMGLRQRKSSAEGTALLELFGVPILRAFSNRQAQRLFYMFTEVHISNYLPGFRRLVDVLPVLRPLESGLAWIDRHTKKVWGFYQVIEVRK